MKLINLIFCHLIGDYVLQIDYIAKTKSSNFYHLLVHCILYCLPFYIVFGLVWQLIPLLLTHIVIDYLKASRNRISYWLDQILHYLICLIYFI